MHSKQNYAVEAKLIDLNAYPISERTLNQLEERLLGAERVAQFVTNYHANARLTFYC